MTPNEDYCSYELSKLLKEKGFDFENQDEGVQQLLSLEHNDVYYTITHSLAMKWLREVHKISVEVYACCDKKKDGKIWAYSICNIYDADKSLAPASQYHSTYEEAVEAAIKYSLENLI